MDSVLEGQRRAHEEIERAERAAATVVLGGRPRLHKERILQEHRINTLLLRIQATSKQLLESYKDENGARRTEIAAIASSSTGTEFTEFYARLKEIKDYHRRYPNQVVEPMENEFLNTDNERELGKLETLFSGAESYGRYLDLHLLFDTYINLKSVKKMSYLMFLSEYDHFESIPKDTKTTREYEQYLIDFITYLESVFKRAKPLVNIDTVRKDAEEEFGKLWEENGVVGWERLIGNGSEDPASLFCVACQKQFAKKTVFDAHLSGKKHIKAAERLTTITTSNDNLTDLESLKQTKLQELDTQQRLLAYKEYLIRTYSTHLTTLRADTKSNIERKQALTGKERLEEDEQDLELPTRLTTGSENGDEDENEDDDEKIYNPLKIPLGWDGKPIPFWLYKLHGLGVEYPCEICGNFVYKGRKAFERHFVEGRHAHGMKCLGIPNSKQFFEITLIEDAIALWERMKVEAKSVEFEEDGMEEFEDAEGNVFNKKTYEDLKRQGLL